MSIEERVKALEDQWQALARVFVAPPTTPTPAATVKPLGRFTDETLSNVTIDLNGDIKANKFITDKEMWNRINEDLRANGYLWVSAGKDSRWSRKQ